MSYAAKIPSYLIFSGLHKPKETPTRVCWDRLPLSDPNQKDARRFQEQVSEWGYWATDSKKEIEKDKKSKHCFVYENKPTKLALVGWDTENMQACLPSGHVIKLPLDIFFNAIRNKGFESDNKTLKGKFIFVMANRKLIPIQVGSGIHKGILDHIKRKMKPKINVEDLVVGNLYSTPGGDTALFLGYVNTETMVVDLPPGVPRWTYPGGNNKQTVSVDTPIQNFEVRFLKKKLATLWFETNLCNWQGTPYKPEDLLSKIDVSLENKFNLFAFRCKKSHSYVTKISNFYVELPTAIVLQVRNAHNQVARAAIEEYRLHRGCNVAFGKSLLASKGPIDKLRHFDAIRIEDLAAECNMTLYGMGIIRSDVFSQFDPWEVKTKKRKRKKS